MPIYLSSVDFYAALFHMFEFSFIFEIILKLNPHTLLEGIYWNFFSSVNSSERRKRDYTSLQSFNSTFTNISTYLQI